MRIFIRSFAMTLLLTLSVLLPGNGQPGNFHGKLVDALTGKAIDYGIVYNFSKNIHIYSTPDGEFNMTASRGDTLVVSALGFYYGKAVLTDSLLLAASPVVFRIEPRAYEISEARIVSLGTYAEFKQNFVHLDRPKTATEKLADNLAVISREVAKEAFAQAQVMRKSENGITLMSMSILTRDERERLELARIMEKEKVRDTIFEKYSPMVVKRVTGLTADDEVIEFMQFCDFTDGYLLKVNPYDLMLAIEAKYRLFKARKRAGDEGITPGGSIPPGING